MHVQEMVQPQPSLELTAVRVLERPPSIGASMPRPAAMRAAARLRRNNSGNKRRRHFMRSNSVSAIEAAKLNSVLSIESN